MTQRDSLQSSESTVMNTLYLNKANLHFLKRHLDTVTQLGVSLKTLERAVHFPTDTAVLKNQPMALREMRKHNW